MSWSLGSPLPELLDVVERKIVAREVQHGVKQHAGMSIGENEAVTARPMGISGIVTQIAVPQRKRQGRQRHRSSRMSAVGLLHSVHRERTNGVNAEAIELTLLLRFVVEPVFGTYCDGSCHFLRGRLLFSCCGNIDLTSHRLPPFCYPQQFVLLVER